MTFEKAFAKAKELAEEYGIKFQDEREVFVWVAFLANMKGDKRKEEFFRLAAAHAYGVISVEEMRAGWRRLGF